MSIFQISYINNSMKKAIVTSLLVFMSLTVILLGLILYLHKLTSSTVLELRGKYPVYKNNEYILVDKKPTNWVSVDNVAYKAKWAIIVSEDWAFYDHTGIDENQLKIVIEESLDAGKFVRGASTITQQVVKNSLLSSEKTLERKLKEMFLALYLEHYFSKDEILEYYLNLVELGENIFGIKQASKLYFQKHPNQLTAKEGAFLAMLLPSPVRYSQSFRNKELTEFAREQISNILVKLRQAKIITEGERVIFENEKLIFEADNELNSDLLSVENESYDLIEAP